MATMSSRDAEAFNAPRSAIVIVSSRACVLWSIQELGSMTSLALSRRSLFVASPSVCGMEWSPPFCDGVGVGWWCWVAGQSHGVVLLGAGPVGPVQLLPLVRCVSVSVSRMLLACEYSVTVSLVKGETRPARAEHICGGGCCCGSRVPLSVYSLRRLDRRPRRQLA